MATFPSILAGVGTRKQVAFNTLRAQFGDGYSQRVVNGLNNVRETWNVIFDNLTIADATTIETFIRDQEGVTSFDWTPPGEASPRKFICTPDSFNVTPAVGGVVETLTMTFQEEFDL